MAPPPALPRAAGLPGGLDPRRLFKVAAVVAVVLLAYGIEVSFLLELPPQQPGRSSAEDNLLRNMVPSVEDTQRACDAIVQHLT